MTSVTGRIVAVTAAAVALGAGPLTMVGCGTEDDRVRVFAASSLTDVLVDVVGAFSATPEGAGVDIEIVHGGSSALVTQIIEGAPADIVLTADEASMQRLSSEVGLDPITAFATNTLVIAVEPGNPHGVTGLDDLNASGILVSLCATQVPCGALTQALLAAEGVALEPSTFEPNVRAVRARVAAGEVDAGLVYRTDVIEGVEAVEVDAGSDHVNTYSASVLTDAPGAQALLEFLVSPSGQRIIADAGFGPIP